MTAEEALAFVRKHGVVLASAPGPVPTLVTAVVGAPVKGSWWGHPKGREIFRVLSAVRESPDVLVCRLVDNKITFVHRRLWPALVRLAPRFEPRQIAQVHEEHTASGRHVTRDIPFPNWVPSDVKSESQTLSEREALKSLGEWAGK
jgi:hypothetical protein